VRNLDAGEQQQQIPAPHFHRRTRRLTRPREGPLLEPLNSTQNAGSSVRSTRLVRVTHPFHPQWPGVRLRARAIQLHGVRVLLSVDDDTVCAIPSSGPI
jgi:hypothetical protein